MGGRVDAGSLEAAQLDQPREGGVCRAHLVEGAAALDPAVLHEDQLVAVAHGRESVGNDDERGVAVQRRDGAGDLVLGLVV